MMTSGSSLVDEQPSEARRSGNRAIEEYRAEIGVRTNAGEQCKQIADALQAKGFQVSDKTVSRWRVAWALRKRAEPSSKGTHLRQPRARSNREGRRRVRINKDQVARLTREGKTADEIVDIVQAQGIVLRAGASAIHRLQTGWKFIPYDRTRARGAGIWKKKKSSDQQPGARQRKCKSNGASLQVKVPDGRVLHYPADCAFGPQKRAPGARRPDYVAQPQVMGAGTEEAIDIDSDSEPDQGYYHQSDDETLAVGDGAEANTAVDQQSYAPELRQQ